MKSAQISSGRLNWPTNAFTNSLGAGELFVSRALRDRLPVIAYRRRSGQFNIATAALGIPPASLVKHYLQPKGASSSFAISSLHVHCAAPDRARWISTA